MSVQSATETVANNENTQNNNSPSLPAVLEDTSEKIDDRKMEMSHSESQNIDMGSSTIQSHQVSSAENKGGLSELSTTVPADKNASHATNTQHIKHDFVSITEPEQKDPEISTDYVAMSSAEQTEKHANQQSELATTGCCIVM